MFDALETGFGLDVVLWLQNMRVPALEILVKILDYMGEELLYIAIIALIYWLFNKNLGLRLIFMLALAHITVSFAKDILATERPYEVSALVNELVQEETYGLPSGHVLISLAVWGYLAYRLRRPWVWALVLGYVTVQGFGRMIAGAHYPQDVLAGWLLGSGLIFLYSRFEDKFAEFWNSRQSNIKIGIVIAIVLLVYGVVFGLSLKAPLAITLSESPCPNGTKLVETSCMKTPHLENYFTSLGLILGAVGATALNLNFKVNPQLWRRIAFYVAGLVFAWLLLMVSSRVVDAISEKGFLAFSLRAIRYSIVAFAAMGLWPLLGLRFGFLEKTDTSNE